MPTLQLDLFGGFYNILPSFTLSPTETVRTDEWVPPASGNTLNGGTYWFPGYYRDRSIFGFQMGAAPTSCRSLYAHGCSHVDTPEYHSESETWFVPCCLTVAPSCNCLSESECGNCNACSDCCECSYCSHCCEAVYSNDICRFCGNCSDCCDGCREADCCHRQMDCSECGQCEYHGCECECDCGECGDSEGMTYSDRNCELPGSDGFRFGIELEFVGLAVTRDSNRRTLLDALESAGIAAVYTNDHDQTSLSRWTVKPDGSVYDGGEIVSPPMDWNDPESRDAIRDVCAVLRSCGATVSDLCGLHIHVEAKHRDGTRFTTQQLRNVALLAIAHEDSLYRIAASDTGMIRSGARSYAKPLSAAHSRLSLSDATDSDIRSALMGDRYRSVNFQSFGKHGTVEFRVCNATLTASRIIAQVALMFGFMSAARRGDEIPSTECGTFHILGSAYSGKCEPDETLHSLHALMRDPDSQHMSNEDWNALMDFCWKGSASQAPISAMY